MKSRHFLKRVNREVAEAAKKVMKKLKEEIEKKGLKLSVTEHGKEGRKEGRSKMIVSCGFLDNELSQFSKEEGLTLADSGETLGLDLRTRVKRLGSERKSEKEKVQGEVLDYQAQ